MFFYQVVFNRPIAFTKSDMSSLTYASDTELPIGIRVLAELGSSLLTGVIVENTQNLNAVYDMQKKGIVIKHIQKQIDKESLITLDQIALARWMSTYYLASWGECIFTIIPSAKKERETSFSELIISHFNVEKPVLSGAQQECIENIKKSYYDDETTMCYIYGITGSGKTEVFLSCIQDVIAQDRQVIYLVPEITLVKQCYPLFSARFGEDNIAVIHSHLTGSQKLTEWNRIKSQEAKVVLGVRSAIFAPVKDLGVIIIDEEHDSSYKSGASPRYHARQVAMKRSQQHESLLLMGSATPSIEAWAYKEKPSMKFMTLKKRVAGGKLPKIQLVSLAHVAGCVSPILQQCIEETLANQEQVLLLLNRRGFSQTFLCTHCGKIVQCPNCSVNISYHQSNNSGSILMCHHCGYHTSVPETCPHCNYVSLSVKGWGIQRVEEELKKLFPQVNIARIDSDVAKDKEYSEEILGKFYCNEIQIMVGTQILAKGINIPNLTLVGVLFADALLGIPDFRAEERAFSLITQVSGRAGRFSEKGKVIIQSYGIENKFFTNIKEGKNIDFFEEELSRRKEYNLSPFQRTLRLVFRGAKEENVQKITEMFFEEVQAYLKQQNLVCNILGPSACVIEKLSNNYRYHMILTANTQHMLNQICRDVLIQGLKSKSSAKKVYIEIDPDPINLY